MYSIYTIVVPDGCTSNEVTL